MARANSDWGSFPARRALQHITYVAGGFRDSQQAALLIQQHAHFVEGGIVQVRQVGRKQRIDIPAAGAHHQAGQSRVPHGNIDGPAVAEGRDLRASRAQVTDHHPFAAPAQLPLTADLLRHVLE